jgi:hypothetical protein
VRIITRHIPLIIHSPKKTMLINENCAIILGIRIY